MSLTQNKMGPGLFHYYNNGPVFQNVDEPNLRESTLKKSDRSSIK